MVTNKVINGLIFNIILLILAPNDERKAPPDNILISFFITSDHRIIIKEVQELDLGAQLISLVSPHIIILLDGSINRIILSDFHGMEKNDDTIRPALLNFSYHLSLGLLPSLLIQYFPCVSSLTLKEPSTPNRDFNARVILYSRLHAN